MRIRSRASIRLAAEGRKPRAARWRAPAAFAFGCATAAIFRSRAIWGCLRADLQLVLPGEPDQGLSRRQHRSCNRPDGKRYAELGTAFVYREKIVADCTCNGKDAFGLVNTPVEQDATLRPGDIVATNGGLMAYNGGRNQTAQFTPIESYSGLSAELRQRLTETKIEPAAEPAPPPAPAKVKQADAPPAARSSRTRRVQLDSRLAA